MKAIVLALLFAGLCGPAAAHAFLQKASPAAGDNLSSGPARIELHFTEALEPAFSSIAITNAAGSDMSAGSVAVHGTEMELPLKPLAPGRYRISWHAVSVDTHRTEGKYNFLVLP